MAPREKRLRGDIQMVFQNPYGSLNPRQTIGSTLEEPLLVNTGLPAAEREKQARAMMVRVGLRPEYYDRYPPHVLGRPAPAHRHRPRPDAAGPRSWCWTSRCRRSTCRSAAQVLNLLADLQDEFGLAYVFVSPRFVGRPAYRRSDHGYLSRPHRGDGRQRDPVRRAASPVYAGAAVGDPRSPTPAPSASAIVLKGELPLAFQPAARLRLPHPLSPSPSTGAGSTCHSSCPSRAGDVACWGRGRLMSSGPGSRAGALPLVGGALALDFANTSSGRETEDHRDHLRGIDDLLAWAAHAGIIDAADGGGAAAALPDRARRGATVCSPARSPYGRRSIRSMRPSPATAHPRRTRSTRSPQRRRPVSRGVA